MALQLFKIETVEVASPVASVTFSNIPQGYTDLILKASARTDRASTYSTLVLRPNSNTTAANYSYKLLEGNGASVSSASNAGTYNYVQVGTIDAANATASTFGTSEVYIPNYAGSANKSFSCESANETNATTAYTDLVANLWAQTTAISSLYLYDANGGNFVANSTFTLYGVL